MESHVGRLDRASTPSKAKLTDEGFLKASSVVTRTGVFLYQNVDGSIRRELRHPDDVFNQDSLSTMKMLPITDDHPQQRIVNSDNFKELVIGYTGESIHLDGSHVIANLIISDSKAVKTVKDLGKRELSLGYSTDLVEERGVYEGEPYDYRQTNIKYNHLSLVSRARAGAAARIHLDQGDAIQIDTGENPMEEKHTTIQLDHVDYKVQPEVSKAFQAEKKRADSASAELEALSSKLNTLNSELEQLRAERDGLREKLQATEVKTDEAIINEKVKERIGFIKVAEKVVASDMKLDEMSNLEIQKAVIKAKFPKSNLDDKSNDYLRGLYDVAIEDLSTAPADLSKKMVTVDTAETILSLDQAREKQKTYLETNYKVGAK